MRPALPLLLALCCVIGLAAGCSYNRDKLDNTTWTSEPTTIKNVELSEGARVIEFKLDEEKQQILIYAVKDPKDPNAEPRILTGKYEYNSWDRVTLKFDEKLNDRKQHVEKIVLSADGKQMTMTDSDGTSVTFRRTYSPMKKTE